MLYTAFQNLVAPWSNPGALGILPGLEGRTGRVVLALWHASRLQLGNAACQLHCNLEKRRPRTRSVEERARKNDGKRRKGRGRRDSQEVQRGERQRDQSLTAERERDEMTVAKREREREGRDGERKKERKRGVVGGRQR